MTYRVNKWDCGEHRSKRVGERIAVETGLQRESLVGAGAGME